MNGLGPAELERYSRQLVLPQWSERAQLALRDASVLVVGVGALGSPAAQYLAAAGVGRIGLVDHDRVELSNLARQPLHYTPDVGVPKAASAAAKLRYLNPEIHVEEFPARLGPDNAAGLLAGYDVVVDGSDSFETRYAVNAACCMARTALVEGGVLGWAGLVLTVRPGATACYRCAFPAPPAPGAVATCAQAGVIGPVAGVVGSLQALEAIKVLTSTAPALLDTMLEVDLFAGHTTRVALRRRPDCPDCGAL